MARGNHNPPKNKITLTPAQEAYLIRHFKNTKNEVFVEKFGVSLRTVIRIARSLGLSKTPQFMKKSQRCAADAAIVSHRRHGTYPKKGEYSENLQKGAAHQFAPGHKEDLRTKKRRIAKCTATMNQLRKEEKARILFGLPQKTKLKLKKSPKGATTWRYFLRKLGYVVPRGSRIAYYTEHTNRDNTYERRRQGDKGYIWFQFKPIAELQP